MQFLDGAIAMRRIVDALTDQKAACGPAQNRFRGNAQEERRCARPIPPPHGGLRCSQSKLASNAYDAIEKLVLVRPTHVRPELAPRKS